MFGRSYRLPPSEPGPGRELDGGIESVLTAPPWDALNFCQHGGHRHSTDPAPVPSVTLRMRQPYDVVNVLSPFVSGDRRLQPTHF
jgi:hypothetical protein